MIEYSKKEDLTEIFDKFDADGLGFISKDEFITIITESKLEVQNAEVLSFFNKFDTNKDGKLSFDEFYYFYTYNEGQFKEMVEIFGLSTKLAQYMKNLEKVQKSF